MADKVCIVGLRMSQKTSNKIEKKASKAGLSNADYIRKCLDEIEIVRDKPSKELLNDLDKVYRILRQIENIEEDYQKTGIFDQLSFKIIINNLNK